MLKEFDDNIEPTAGENVSNKQYIKKITKRKYTLGKSPKYRKVGVLIKGRQTKKNIINSHKKLKHTDIHQIKKYLKKHGMLKTGSSCPDEILRKMYESSMLSGDINNTNKNTLIHNFLNYCINLTIYLIDYLILTNNYFSNLNNLMFLLLYH